MNNPRRLLLLFAVLICLFSASCSQMKEAGKTLGALAEVRGEIIKKFGENDVNVNYRSMGTSSAIQVTYVNSPLNLKEAVERQACAQETANIVRDHYADIKNVSEILVSFMKVETKFLVVTTSMGLDYFVFDNQAKPVANFGEGSSGSTDEDGLTPSVVYNQPKNETNITSRIQLAGVPERGLTMLPTMRVVGDTSRATPKAPREVTFDFASFSEKAKFAEETFVRFKGDDQVIFESRQEFSKGAGSDGLVNQFSYLTMPFAKFRQLTECKMMNVLVGDYDFELSEKQIDALRKMVQYTKL